MRLKILFVVLFLLQASFGLAQSSDVVDANEISKTSMEVEESDVTPESKTKKDQNVEKIEVTGSYVRRIDIEGPSPVVTIQAEDFNEAGLDTVTDLLRESPLFSGSTDSGNRDGFFYFRGQHAGSTLILINGMRVPKLGGPDRGFYAGVENIPTNVIERVEIVKDGSSALYGSDAMAGVMNFITKKDYDGVEYSNRINIPEIGEGLQQNHTLAFGKSYSRGSWFMSSQYVEQRGYTLADVGSYIQGPAARAGSKAESKTFSSATTTRYNEKSEFGPGCPAGVSECTIDTLAMQYAREPRENLGTLLSGRYDVNSDITVSMIGMYNRRRRMDIGLPYWINVNNQSDAGRMRVADLGSQGLKTKLANDPAASEFVEFSNIPLDEVGMRQIAVLQNSYTAQSKVEGYFLDTWKWDLSGSYAYSNEERDHQNGLVTTSGVVGALQSGWDPTNIQASNRGALDAARIQGIEAYESSMASARLIATGELFELQDLYGAGGPVSIAVGTESQWETTNDAHDQILIDQVLNYNFEENQAGSRTVNSVFAELVAYPLDSVETQVAGRLDNYSDFGGTFNPKISLAYRPSNKVLFRSSWGTNFNAPSVRNMTFRDTPSYENIEFCDDCGRRLFQATRYRRDDLRPERGVNYNFGTVIQPNKMWTFTIDQWNFNGRDTISRLSDGAYSAIYQSFNGQDADQKMGEIGAEIVRNPDGSLASVRLPAVINMGERTIRGLDFNVAFSNPVRVFGQVLKARFGFDHSHILIHKTRSAPTLTEYYRSDLEWKNTLSMAVATSSHSYRLAARTLAGDTTDDSSVRTHTEYDFNYGWSIPWWSGRVSVGAKNLLNTRPPVNRGEDVVDFTRGRNTAAFNALGRRYYVGYSHSF